MTKSLINHSMNDERKISYALMFFYAMLILSVFDYKTASDGDKFIVILLGVAITIAGLLAVSTIKIWSKKSLIIISSMFSFLAMGVASGLYRGQGVFSVLSMSVPLVLFLISIIFLSSLRPEYSKVKAVVTSITLFMLLSVIFKLIFGFYYYEQTISSVRYQIISPSIILMFAYGITSLLYQKKRLGLVFLVLPIVVIFISVTRSYLLVFFLMGLFLISSYSLKNWIKYYPVIIKISFTFLLAACATYISFPDAYNRWILRLFSSVADQGVDVTAVTRLAEIKYQLSVLLDAPINLIIGMGLAAETRFSPEYKEVLSLVFRDDYEYIGRGYGHNTYIGIIYVGGIFFGSFLIYALLTALVSAMKASKLKIRQVIVFNDKGFILIWGTTAALGYTIYGMLGGTFGDRVAAMCYGISFGLSFLGRKTI